jgi:hypothetical protein
MKLQFTFLFLISAAAYAEPASRINVTNQFVGSEIQFQTDKPMQLWVEVPREIREITSFKKGDPKTYRLSYFREMHLDRKTCFLTYFDDVKTSDPEFDAKLALLKEKLAKNKTKYLAPERKWSVDKEHRISDWGRTLILTSKNDEGLENKMTVRCFLLGSSSNISQGEPLSAAETLQVLQSRGIVVTKKGAPFVATEELKEVPKTARSVDKAALATAECAKQ